MLEDLLRRFRGVYYSAPDFIKLPIGRTYALLPASIRMGAQYVQFTRLLEQSRNWSKQQVMDYQYVELKKTLAIAFAYIPHYQKKFSEFGISLSDFKSPEDLRRFPYTTKKEIKDNFQALINTTIPPWRHLVTTTGGSTAEPMRFLQLKGVTRSKERAFIYSGWKRIGYRPGARIVQLRGRSVGCPEKGIHWDVEPIQNMLEMDSNYLTPDRMDAYLRAIHRFQPEFMTGFPSSVYLLAKFIREEKLDPPPLKGIMLASENLYPWQRAMLESLFDCPIVSHYGHSEMVILAMQAETTNDLLAFPEYGYMELISRDGRSISTTGTIGEIVGTSFHNPVMPFIRYRTQDYAEIGHGSIDGYPYPVLREVEGRLQEFIVTKDKRLISICTMGAAHFDKLDNVYETQYFQDRVGEIEFRVVPKNGYSSRDRDEIKRAIEEKTERAVTVAIVEVNEIFKPSSGKHLMLLQKLPQAVLDGSQSYLIQ